MSILVVITSYIMVWSSICPKNISLYSLWSALTLIEISTFGEKTYLIHVFLYRITAAMFLCLQQWIIILIINNTTMLLLQCQLIVYFLVQAHFFYWVPWTLFSLACRFGRLSERLQPYFSPFSFPNLHTFPPFFLSQLSVILP
jgi:hypothetical protein